ncbi:Nn.00g061160.m01.CDS01 [Neocucurbitaria sp. VM-36]
MTELLDLCYDVLIRILEEINPEDLAACAQTSWAFNNFIKKNTRLYKAHYLRNFDDPRQRPVDPEPDWVADLQKLVKCQKMLQSANNDLKRDEFKFVATTVESMIATGSTDAFGDSHNQDLITKLFQHISQNHDAFMCRSSLFGRVGKQNQRPADDKDGRQLSAKLHCLFGIPSTNAGRRVLSTHPHARSRVYDLRNYTDKTEWGPFQDDGSMRVDWEMIESIMIVLGYNSGLCCRRFLTRFRPPWTEPLEGVIPERSKILPEYPPKLLMEPDIPLQLKDPYNVSGIWSRIVCFLDYNDLFNFNFSPEAMKVSSDELRETITTEEAIRHIMMDLQVTEVHAPGQFDNSSLPVVHFTGKSKSVDAAWDPNANSKLRGSVRLTAEGEVRWQTISVFYGGEERWRSEGIQVGGVRSSRGVIGTWFDKDFDPHGPAGPTAFWKISDRHLCDHGEESDSEEEGSWHL